MVTHAPTVSIVLPTYNRESLLRAAVASAAGQTFQDWELIVADDGSTDGTREYVERLADDRVRVVLLPHSGSAAIVRNAGVDASRGRWIAFLDSDDLWLPGKLERQLEALVANPSRLWSCTAVSFIDGNGNPMSQISGTPYVARSGWVLERLLTFDTAATLSTLLVDRALFDAVGGFDSSFTVTSREDYDLVLRLAARSEIEALPEPLTVIRHHGGRTTSTQRVADLYRFNELAFRNAERVATTPRLRRICRRQRATQFAQRARALSREGDHRNALASAVSALRCAPFSSSAWRAAGGSLRRWLASGLGR